MPHCGILLEFISFGGIQMENIGLSVLGGLVGTYIMVLGGYYAAEFGLPKLDFAALLGSKFTQEERLMRAWGMPQVFANGIIFAFIYSGFLYDVLPGAPWFRGLIYGFMLWLFAGFVILPLLFHAGLFGLRHEKLATVGAFFAHLSYGVALGLIYYP
jgi:hypothetical protein